MGDCHILIIFVWIEKNISFVFFLNLCPKWNENSPQEVNFSEKKKEVFFSHPTEESYDLELLEALVPGPTFKCSNS